MERWRGGEGEGWVRGGLAGEVLDPNNCSAFLFLEETKKRCCQIPPVPRSSKSQTVEIDRGPPKDPPDLLVPAPRVSRGEVITPHDLAVPS